jgi:hypothetical protein
MTEVLLLALSFPGVVYTVLLGVVLVYWLFVVAGAIHLGDGSADGHFDGIGEHGADVGDVGHHGVDVADGSDAGDGDADADASDGAVAALIHALHLRSVPITVIFSLIITFSWLVCTIAMQVVSRAMPAEAQALFGWLVLVGSPLVALPLTSLSARPLVKVFAHRSATSHSDLIGKTCVVRTGTVTSTFGEASLEDGGAGLVLRVRVDREPKAGVKRGDQMLIVEWDRERESFLVEPMDVLEPRGGRDDSEMKR